MYSNTSLNQARIVCAVTQILCAIVSGPMDSFSKQVTINSETQANDLFATT